jgi:hypothetical protein
MWQCRLKKVIVYLTKYAGVTHDAASAAQTLCTSEAA